jgi:hypothetical protein
MPIKRSVARAEIVDLPDTITMRSSYVAGIEVKDVEALSDPSTFLAISFMVVGISGPPFETHGLVTSRRLDSVEAER